jgi:hypothetical protein
MLSGVNRAPADMANDFDNFEVKINPLAVKTLSSNEIISARTNNGNSKTNLVLN